MDKITEVISEAFTINQELIIINIFGWKIPISETLISLWIVMAIIIALAVYLTRGLKKIPGRRQAVAELLVDNVNSFVRSNIGHYWKSVAPYVGTVLLFLFVANSVSIFDIFPTSSFFYEVLHIEAFKNVPVFNIKPPTKDVNVIALMALMSMAAVVYYTIKLRGGKAMMKTFVSPVPLLLPVKILDYFIRPLSLTLRMFGNIIAAFTFMEVIKTLAPVAVPAFCSIYFDLFDGAIQAYIFVFLTLIYINENLEEEV